MATGERTADARSGGDESLDRVLTVPNAVTAIRLACVPIFVWLLFGAHHQAAAAVLLGVLGATDWVDGQLARRLHQVSTVGKVLDPVADRILVATAVVAVVVHGAVPLWFGVATVAREALVAGATLALAALGARRIDVLWVGKAGTFGLMFAYPAFLLGDGRAAWQVAMRDGAWVAGGVGLLLAWIAAAWYIGPARAALSEGRTGRAGSAVDPAGAVDPARAVDPVPAWAQVSPRAVDLSARPPSGQPAPGGGEVTR